MYYVHVRMDCGYVLSEDVEWISRPVDKVWSFDSCEEMDEAFDWLEESMLSEFGDVFDFYECDEEGRRLPDFD